MRALTLRDAADSDAARIAAVHIASWRVAYRGLLSDELLDGLTLAGRTELWQRRIAAWEVLVADDAQTGIVGFCELRRADARPPLIHALYLHPDVLRGGIGTALVEETVCRLRADGEREVELDVVQGNARARAFYDRIGFEPTGEREQWHGVTQLRMRRRLTS